MESGGRRKEYLVQHIMYLVALLEIFLHEISDVRFICTTTHYTGCNLLHTLLAGLSFVAHVLAYSILLANFGPKN